MNHEIFMRRCFQLAQLGAGAVSPNPQVGSVLVAENGKIIGEGYHQKYGGPHAEVNCFASVSAENQLLVRNATLYCNLEPCFHFGKTPPCVDLVVAKKVKRVVIANADPNPLVAGRSIEKMRAAGIEVLTGILSEMGATLNAPFFKWILKKQPYIILKWAQSSDGFIGKMGQRIAISEPSTQRLVHRWRSEVDAILVGTNTLLSDNPRLDTRFYPGKNPLRVGIDQHGKMPATAAMLDDSTPTWVLGKGRAAEWQHTLFFDDVFGKNMIINLLDKLYAAQKAILLVEGGADLHRQFIEIGCWDEIRLIQNSKWLANGVRAANLPANAHLTQKINLQNDTIHIFKPNQDPL